MMIQSQSTKKGFTLLELLAVMAIMMILATIAVTSYRSMVSGSGVGASLAHMKQTLSLARQQAIMQGKNAYVVFYQNTNSVPAESWYVTCLGEGTKTDRDGSPKYLLDRYRSDLGQIRVGSILYNLSEDKATFATVSGTAYDAELNSYEVSMDADIWTDDCRYGWEISRRVQLPRGFQFAENPPSTIRFKPNGTAANVSGSPLQDKHVWIKEEIRPTEAYAVVVDFSGSIKVVY